MEHRDPETKNGCKGGYYSLLNLTLIKYAFPSTHKATREHIGDWEQLPFKRLLQSNGYDHSLFNTNHLKYDVAILLLNGTVEISSKVRPIKLPSQGSRIASGKTCYIT
ncbi:hypothetical protein QZH41_017569, partial [Actinostola sp. cb2023]